jgi:hypothetical protein
LAKLSAALGGMDGKHFVNISSISVITLEQLA